MVTFPTFGSGPVDQNSRSSPDRLGEKWILLIGFEILCGTPAKMLSAHFWLVEQLTTAHRLILKCPMTAQDRPEAPHISSNTISVWRRRKWRHQTTTRLRLLVSNTRPLSRPSRTECRSSECRRKWLRSKERSSWDEVRVELQHECGQNANLLSLNKVRMLVKFEIRSECGQK